MFESGSRERTLHGRVLRLAHRLVHFVHASVGKAATEEGPRFYGQMVCRNMLYAQIDRTFKTSRECLAAEAFDAEYQIHRNVAVTCILKTVHGRHGLSRRMASAHEAKLRIIERLHPEAHAVDIGAPQCRDILLCHVVGIGFDGDLLHAAAVVEPARLVDQTLQYVGPHKRRSAAAEIYGTDRMVGEEVAPAPQLRRHGLQRIIHVPQVARTEKIAVGADVFAERYVEI